MIYPTFKHYQIVSQLYEGKQTLLLRAIRTTDQAQVVIKYLKPEFSTLTSMQQLTTEYERQKDIKSPHVVKTLELLTLPNSIALVMEDYPYPSLQEILKQKLELETKLKIACNIAKALGEIHHEQVIHKDIKPQNILVDINSHDIKIIDFGISSLLGRELQQLVPPEALEGTLPYMSPEQTGRINRPLDYRSDIYSLGATLYHFFTGQPPFEESSPLNYIHAHIAKSPPVPIKVPANLGRILLKCLSKTAEERYHSAFGLMADLSSFDRFDFALGQRDVFDHFHYPEKLYGREAEVAKIEEAFQKALKGDKFLLTLKGYAGVGKSSLATVAQKFSTEMGARFVQSKFDQFKRTVPYQGIANALQKLVQRMLMEPDENLREWKSHLKEALGNNGQVLIDIIPDVEIIIGKQPNLLKLPPQATLNRMKYTLMNFFKAIQKPGSPLIIFLDDLQWADEPSLNLLVYIFEDPAVKNLLILGAYRDNEISPSHPTSLALKEIAARGGEIIEMEVHPLTENSIKELIQDSFQGEGEQAQALGALIYKKAQGNPFFSLQLLKKLYEQNLLNFDMERVAWFADLNAIGNWQVTDNVVDFLVGELQKVDPPVLELLKVGSAIENRFPLDLIASIVEKSEEEVRELLKGALRKDFLLQEEGALSYRFMHDRIQQAVYSLLDEQEKTRIHEKIGRTLLNKISRNKLGEQVIEIVNHLNHADISLWDPKDKARLSHLNLMAGIRAKDSGAFSQSIQYFRKGIEFLPVAKWAQEGNLTENLYENLALSLIVTGGVKEAEEIFDQLVNKCTNETDRGRIWSVRLMGYAQLRDYDRLFEQAEKVLAHYGYHFEKDPSNWTLMKTLAKLKLKLLFTRLDKAVQGAEAPDDRTHNVTSILSSLCYPAFILNKKNQYIKNAVDIILFTLENGVTSNTSVGIGSFAIYMGSEIMQKYAESYELSLVSLEAAARYPKTAESASILFSHYAFMHRWKYPLREAALPIKQAYRSLMETGAGALGASCAIYCNLIPLLSGDNLMNIFNSVTDSLNDIKKYSSKAEELSLCVLREVCTALQGRNQDASDPYPSEFSEVSERGDNVIYQARYAIWHTILSYLFGQESKALEIAKPTAEFIHKYPNWVEWHPFYFIYALALVESLKKAPSKEHQTLLKECIEKLKRWGEASPLNYSHHLYLVEAEQSTLTSSPDKIESLYEKAIEAAKKSENIQDIALAYELYGKYLYKQNNSYGARILLQKALQYYHKWGAEAKSRQIKSQYKKLFDQRKEGEEAQRNLQDTYPGRTGTDNKTQLLDVNTILEASHTLSREISLDKLIESLMHLLIVNAGADRAFLILTEDKGLFIHSQIFLNNRYIPLIAPIPIEEKQKELSFGIVNYVFRTGEPVLLEEAAHAGAFTEDPFVKEIGAKSVLCLPLRHKQQMAGILYLENRAAKGVFTSKKAKILTMLSSQIAVSLVNALLYEKLEMRVQERTQELQDKNKELQEAFHTIRTVQEQMLQKEKIASLGLMTAGIGQELNAPIAQVNSTTKELQAQLDMLKQLPKEQRMSKIAEIRGCLQSVEKGGKQADAIIKALLTYAHQGSSASQKIDPTELLQQALEYVSDLFHEKAPTFKVVSILNHSPQPLQIEAYPTDLMRVFVNLIHNAYDAMLEKWLIDQNYKPILNITITNKRNKTEIKIHDNGPGISEDLLPEIFVPFSLRKRGETIGGFGLSIAKDIITKEHKGTIQVSKYLNEFEITLELPHGE